MNTLPFGGGQSPRSSDAQVGGDHYKRTTLTPFDLYDAMETTGNVFVDQARAVIIKYAFRKKGDHKKMAEDLRKASHYALAAAERLEAAQ